MYTMYFSGIFLCFFFRGGGAFRRSCYVRYIVSLLYFVYSHEDLEIVLLVSVCKVAISTYCKLAVVYSHECLTYDLE